MTTRSWAEEEKPSFFKVLQGDFSRKMRIPQAFYENFEGKVHQQFRLRTSAGTWLVNVKKVNDKLFFQKGWKKFVQDHNLKLGEFLVFEYSRNSKFYVDIYGKSTCNKEFAKALRKSNTPPEEGNGNTILRPRTNQATTPIEVEVIDIESETSMHTDELETQKNQISQDSESCWPRELNYKDYSSTSVQAVRQRTTRALEAAKKYFSHSKHPFFKTVMNQTNVNSGILCVPTSFVKDYLTEKTGTVKLRVSKSLWTIKLVRSTRFSAGWPKFAKDNALKQGDVCVFELINRANVELKVSIFRCSS